MPTAERKRPWYLVMALLGALGLGAHGASNGWVLMTLYREDIDPTQFARAVADEADRAAIVARFQTLVAALDAAKSRGWPMGVALLLLGSAVAVFAMRALAGSPGARAALVQLVVAHAALDVAHHRILSDVERAEITAFGALQYAQASRDSYEPALARAPTSLAFFLGLRLASGVLIVVALTRRRSRDFFDAMAAAVEER
jgi:hypothetical protein